MGFSPPLCEDELEDRAAYEPAAGGPRRSSGSPPGVAADLLAYCDMPEILRDGFSLSLSSAAEAPGRGIQRAGSTLRRKLLRLAGLGSPSDQFPGRQSRPASAGALVCVGPDGYRGRRHSHALELVGLDVRVLVANVDHAFLSGNAPRRYVLRSGEASDPLCPSARRSVGDFRKLFRHALRR